MTVQIFYRAGFKYQLTETFTIQLDLRPPEDIKHKWCNLSTSGQLTITAGYAWDGPSGPTIDTRNFMRGSLVHDVLYQLIRTDYLGASFKGAADDELRHICRLDGMGRLRSWWVYRGVRRFGASSVLGGARKVFTAP